MRSRGHKERHDIKDDDDFWDTLRDLEQMQVHWCKWFFCACCASGVVFCAQGEQSAPALKHSVGVEVLNVDGRLTHGDFALAAEVEYSTLARARNEWSRLRTNHIAWVWPPRRILCMFDVSLKGAPLSLPTIAVAGFRNFFGREGRSGLLPLGSGRFIHLIVLFVYQGADVCSACHEVELHRMAQCTQPMRRLLSAWRCSSCVWQSNVQ